MKNYFEEPEVNEDWSGDSPDQTDELESPDVLLFSRNMPRNREDLMRLIPEKKIVDRLVMRYFSSQSPSQREKFSSKLMSYITSLTRRRHRPQANIRQTSSSSNLQKTKMMLTTLASTPTSGRTPPQYPSTGSPCSS